MAMVFGRKNPATKLFFQEMENCTMDAKKFDGKFKTLEDLKSVKLLEKISLPDAMRKVISASNLNQKLTYNQAKIFVDFMDENPGALPMDFGVKVSDNKIYTIAEISAICTIIYAMRELQIKADGILNPANTETSPAEKKPMTETQVKELQKFLGLEVTQPAS